MVMTPDDSRPAPDAAKSSTPIVVVAIVGGVLVLLMGSALLGCLGLVWFSAASTKSIGSGTVASAPAPAPTTPLDETLNITYVERGDKALKLDLYQPQGMTKPLPVVVCIHGGGWQSGNKESFAGFARYYAQNGFVAVSVQYRLAPAACYPAQIEDVQCAIRWLRANAEKYQIDKDKLGVVGASAGGHLALLAGLLEDAADLPADTPFADQSSKAQAIVNYFGPADFSKQDWPPVVEQMLVNLMGGDRSKMAKEYAAASPVDYIDGKDPPVITFHGTVDELVPYNQATDLHAALKAAGVENHLETIEHQGHSFSPGEMVRTLEMSRKFLVDVLVQ